MNKEELIKNGLGQAELVVKNTVSYLCNTISYVKDKERVNAFNVMYAIMRVIDDLIDNRKDSSQKTLRDIQMKVMDWKRVVDKCYGGKPEQDPISSAFFDSLSKFKLPKKVWDDFFLSMISDLKGSDFEDFPEFEKYCLGATCAPTVIYLFIILSQKKNEVYVLEGLDYIKIGHDLGIWAYIIHILRDVKKDIDNGLFYMPEEELKKFNLKKEDIINFSKQGVGDSRYKGFLNYYLNKANEYYSNSINKIEDYLNGIPKDRKFAVLIILRVYEEIGKRLQVVGEKIFSGEKVLSVESYKNIEGNLRAELLIKCGSN